MSILALSGARCFRHTLRDDIESLFYVVMYGCVRWLPHEGSTYLGRWIVEFFHKPGPPVPSGRFSGGGVKACQMLSLGKDFLKRFGFQQNEYLQRWFRDGYILLRDPDLTRPEEVKQTMKSFRELVQSVCDGLSAIDGVDSDRVSHDMYGYRASVDCVGSMPPTFIVDGIGNLRGNVSSRFGVCRMEADHAKGTIHAHGKEQLVSEGSVRTLKRKNLTDQDLQKFGEGSRDVRQRSIETTSSQ